AGPPVERGGADPSGARDGGRSGAPDGGGGSGGLALRPGRARSFGRARAPGRPRGVAEPHREEPEEAGQDGGEGEVRPAPADRLDQPRGELAEDELAEGEAASGEGHDEAPLRREPPRHVDGDGQEAGARVADGGHDAVEEDQLPG